jgi:hypothetical protein
VKKADIFSILNFIVFSMVATLAHGEMKQASLLSVNFSAPAVYGSPSSVENPVGTIVYDISVPGFRGLDSSGNWASLAQNSYTAPLVTIHTSGSVHTITGTPLYIRVRMVGGGGGGAGSDNAGLDADPGDDGGDTTFGSLTAGGGKGGPAPGAQNGGQGGTASLGTGPTGTALAGGWGGSSNGGVSTLYPNGGMGAASPFGGNGGGSLVSAGTPAIANTGSGGGGAGGPSGGYAGAGGGAGGFVDAVILNPGSSYSYSIGAKGDGGGAGTSGSAGGDGAAGYIEVTEYYQ